MRASHALLASKGIQGVIKNAGHFVLRPQFGGCLSRLAFGFGCLSLETRREDIIFKKKKKRKLLRQEKKKMGI